jgi:hypothetical protein
MFAAEDGSAMVRTGPTERFLGLYSGRIDDPSELGFVWCTKLAE